MEHKNNQTMGVLWGIGVGPGDPELITIKAVNTIKACDVIAIPKSGDHDHFVAYDIARQAIPEIEDKEQVILTMPMTRDKAYLDQCHDEVTKTLCACLDGGKNVAFLTLGDPTLYSTYTYIHRRVLEKGFSASIVPGIPSFCAVSARLNEGLVEGADPLHILPASYGGVEEALSWKGTKVIMKMGRSVDGVKAMLGRKNLLQAAKMVQNCGMKGEQVWLSLSEAALSSKAGYFSMIVVKEEEKG